MDNTRDNELDHRVGQRPPDISQAAPTASEETARAEAELPGVNGAGRLLGLPRELLVMILRDVGEDMWKLPELRFVSKAMRDAVDAATSKYLWKLSRRESPSASPVSADSGSPPNDMLTRACHSLGQALARHPNLVELGLAFGWRAGHLQRPLDVLIESQHSSLTSLSLTSSGYNETGRALSLRSLEGLRSLHSLSFSNFDEETGWVAALQELTCVRTLQVLWNLPRELPVLPGLTHLRITGFHGSRCRLRLAPSLVSLSVALACLVHLDPLPATLEEVVFESVLCAPGVASLQFQGSTPAALPRLRKLDLNHVDAQVAAGLLAASPGLTSVTLENMENLRTLPQLSALPELKSLTLVALPDLEQLELQHLRSLEHLDVRHSNALRSVTVGPHNSKLEQVGLAGLPLLAAVPDLPPLLALKELHLWGGGLNSIRAPPDLSAVYNLLKLTLNDLIVERLPALESLARLEALTISFCPNVGVLPPLASLARLKELRLLGLSALTSVPDFSSELPSLTFLKIQYCERLESLVLKGSTTLKELTFLGCKSLSQVHLGPFTSFPSLRRFRITACPLLKDWVESLKPRTSVVEFT